eukprot:CAMPEP_0118647504 /NCGR_PEP_ID=MMETSP0785-20121206/8641_1 /TAXON_ID=91992 /ORGANISM="Bolidomonas pacifica, Strain CCMP 1866" /LENGTH=234 /DNA_ID=CAMNT_0006539601 /DNA_START=173 /DNA_END=874 /DNA_ORIENTATION=+
MDPYYHFNSVLEERMDVLTSTVSTYLSTVRTVDTSTSLEYKTQRKNLKKLLKSTEGTLKDLQATVRAVSNDRLKFSHIDDDELSTRRAFVQGMSNRLHNEKQKVNSDEIKGKVLRDERDNVRRNAGSMGARNEAERDNTDFVVDQRADAAVMMRQQDETLEDLDGAVDRVGVLAGNINEELGRQNKMIDELGEDLDEAEERMGAVMGKLSKLLKTKDSCQLWTIISLTLILIVL